MYKFLVLSIIKTFYIQNIKPEKYHLKRVINNITCTKALKPTGQISPEAVNKSSTPGESAFLGILLYFDLFNYPLSMDELFSYAGTTREEVAGARNTLTQLVEKGWIRYYDGFYSINTDRSLVQKRREGNNRALQKMKTAKRYSRIISWFPFVRGVYLSGSISKGVLTESDDIDYFIITHPGRLWLTRSLLTLFKKVFLLNSHKNFCINYFIGSNELPIREQNRFTATEVVFLVPMYNLPLYREFLDANRWVRKYYPSFRQDESRLFDNNPLIKRLLERALGDTFGKWLDDYLMKVSQRVIRNKYRHMDPGYFNKCFLLEKNRLRYLPRCRQYDVMKSYRSSIENFERINRTKLNPE